MTYVTCRAFVFIRRPLSVQNSWREQMNLWFVIKFVWIGTDVWYIWTEHIKVSFILFTLHWTIRLLINQCQNILLNKHISFTALTELTILQNTGYLKFYGRKSNVWAGGMEWRKGKKRWMVSNNPTIGRQSGVPGLGISFE